MIRDGLIVEEGAQVAASTLDTGYNVVLRQGCTVRSNVCIWSNTVIDKGAIVLDGARIHCNCYIAQRCVVGKLAFLGPGVMLANDRYPVRRNPDDWEPVVVGGYAVIGAGSTICPGVIVGMGAMIGAGSTVTKNVPEYQAWAGNPAKRLPLHIERAWLSNRTPANEQDASNIKLALGGV